MADDRGYSPEFWDSVEEKLAARLKEEHEFRDALAGAGTHQMPLSADQAEERAQQLEFDKGLDRHIDNEIWDEEAPDSATLEDELALESIGLPASTSFSSLEEVARHNAMVQDAVALVNGQLDVGAAAAATLAGQGFASAATEATAATPTGGRHAIREPWAPSADRSPGR